jgi:hypothetical protein
MRFKLLIIFSFFCFAVISFGNDNKPPVNGSARVPMRGNSLDVHFVNLTGSKVEITPYFFKNNKKLPVSENRNLLFIPNLGKKKSGKADMPIPFSLEPMTIFTAKDQSRLVAKKFIQGMLVYNNPASYYEKDKEEIYNTKAGLSTYSSYMWTNGVRTRNDGLYAFSKAIDEINNFHYGIKIPVDGDRTISCDLKFAALSNLSSVKITDSSTTGYIQDWNNIAAILTIVGGILAIPTNPPAGIVGMLSGVAWTISGTGWMIESTYSKSKYNLFNVGSSWLSSPFDIYVYPKHCFIKDKENKNISEAEYDQARYRLNYFLGTNSKPETISIQIASSEKGDLYIYFISKTIINKKNVKELLSTNEFQKRNLN